MNKILFGLGAAAVCFAGAAGAQQVESSYDGALTSTDLAFDGVYGGVLLSSHSNTSMAGNFTQPYDNANGAGLYAGYSQRVNDFALGAEVSVDNAQSCGSLLTTICMTNVVDLSLRAGYVINDFQFFAIGGVSAATMQESALNTTEIHAGTHIGIGVEYEMESGAQLGLVVKNRNFSADSPFYGPGTTSQTRSVELRVGYSF